MLCFIKLDPHLFWLPTWICRICLPIQEMQIQSLGQEDPMKEEMATLFSILACKIPWSREPSGLQSMGSQSQK